MNQAGCKEHCEHGPTVVVYPEAIWYRLQTVEDAKEVLECHILETVEKLRIKKTHETVKSELSITLDPNTTNKLETLKEAT